MFDLKNLKKAVEQISEEKGVDPAKVLDAIESSIAAAYKREYMQKGEYVRCRFDLRTGDLQFWQVKVVADETTVRIVNPEEENQETLKQENEAPAVLEEPRSPRYNPDRHILIEEAKKIKPDVQLGEELEFPLETHDDFGRIAAQTAKQVVLQRLREAERESVLGEYKNKEGEIVSGLIQRFDRGNVYIDLGRATGIMFPNETIPGEHYRAGERMRFYVLAVQEESRIPGIILSRSHPKFVSKLLALEVPEISDEIIEVKAIAREPGSRTKIAVLSKAEGVDPVGSCVGQRGTRVMAVSNELGNERLDIVEWSDDPAKFVANALSPAKVKEVEILPKREAIIFVPDDQLSLAIGKGGQNVRLAAKLSGWKIDVRSQSKPEEVLDGGISIGVATEGEEPKFVEPEKDKEDSDKKSPEEKKEKSKTKKTKKEKVAE